MDLGFIEFSVSSKAIRAPKEGRTLKNAFHNLRGVAFTNIILYFAFTYIGAWWSYYFWVLCFLTSFSVIVRIRSIAEHACTSNSVDPRLNSRSILTSIFGRMTFAPHNVNYHLEHHFQMQVPYFRLPDLHKHLKDRGAFDGGGNVVKGYGEVIKLALRDSNRT